MSFFPIVGSQAPKAGLAGTVAKSNGANLIHTSGLASADGSPETITITSSAPDNSSLYSATLNYGDLSIPFSFTTDGSATASELAAGLAASLLSNSLIGVIAQSVEAVAGVVTITCKAGVDASVALVANPSTDLVVGGSAAVAPTQYKFGRAVEVTGVTAEALVAGSPVVVETFASPSGSSSGLRFALVLNDFTDVLLDAIGESSEVTGPQVLRAVSLAKEGAKNWYYVEAPADAITFGAQVLVDGNAGANNGRLAVGAAAGRVAWTGATWVGLSNYPNVAIIQL